MTPDDEAILYEVKRFLRDAIDSLCDVGDGLTECVIDPTGLRSRIERLRDNLTRVTELVDASDGNLLTILGHAKKCLHSSVYQSWSDDSFWMCTACGKVWSGLQWEEHGDDESEKKV